MSRKKQAGATCFMQALLLGPQKGASDSVTDLDPQTWQCLAILGLAKCIVAPKAIDIRNLREGFHRRIGKP